MIRNVERLFEAITGPEWQVENEETGELVKYNFDRTRKLIYIGLDAGRGEVIANMGMYFLNENGGWDEVIGLVYLDFPDKVEKLTISAMARGKNGSRAALDYCFFYDESGRWSRSMGNRGLIADKRVVEDRQELLFSEDEMPKRIDLVLTANLFVDQMIRGEMERPVLVPEGYFPYEELEGVAMERASRLVSEAKSREELRVTKAINQWVVGQEMANLAMDLD